MKRNLLSVLLAFICVVFQFLATSKPVQAATYNFCGKVISGNTLGQNVQFIFHCSSPYAVIYKGPAPVQNTTWVDIKQATIEFLSEYVGASYNGVYYKVVGYLTGFASITTNLSSCPSCSAFSPPITPTPTKKTSNQRSNHINIRLVHTDTSDNY